MNKDVSGAIKAFAVLIGIIAAVFAISGGVVAGLHILSFVINIIGYGIMFLVELLGAVLPNFTETIIQNVITTVIIWVVCTVFWLTKKEESKVSKIIAGIVSAIFTFISWSNFING